MKDTTLESVDFKQQETTPGAIETLNQTGFMFTELSDTSKQYIDFSKSCARVLDIGCAYGISVIPILDYQKTEVFAVDLSAAHLEKLSLSLTNDQKKYFHSYCLNFPLETNFENNYFDAIHISNVLHFIKGADLKLGLQKCFDWLKPNGKIFINTCSLYLPYLKTFISTYEQRKSSGTKWPGEVENYKTFLEKNQALLPDDLLNLAINCAPSFVHVFKKEDLESLVTDIGFKVEQSGYFTLKTLSLLKHTNDDSAWIGMIISKTK